MKTRELSILYLLHIMYLALALPLITILGIIAPILSGLSELPGIGQFFLPVKRGLQNLLVGTLLIPGVGEKISKVRADRQKYVLFCNCPNDFMKNKEVVSRLGDESTPPTFNAQLDRIYISMLGNADFYPYVQDGNQIHLPHVSNRILPHGGISARIDFYVGYIRTLIQNHEAIDKVYIYGHSMGGAILAQVAARLAMEDVFRDKTVTIHLDRTFDSFAHASSGALAHAVPRSLLYFIYRCLDMNIATKSAIAQYSQYKNILTTVTTSTNDLVLQDSVLSYTNAPDNVYMHIEDIGHHALGSAQGVNHEDYKALTLPVDIKHYRPIWFTLDAIVLLTVLQFTGSLDGLYALMFSGIATSSMATILPIMLYSASIVLLLHRLYNAVQFSDALKDREMRADAYVFREAVHIQQSYAAECATFVLSFIIGIGVIISLPIAVNPIIVACSILSVSTAMLVGTIWWSRQAHVNAISSSDSTASSVNIGDATRVDMPVDIKNTTSHQPGHERSLGS